MGTPNRPPHRRPTRSRAWRRRESRRDPQKPERSPPAKTELIRTRRDLWDDLDGRDRALGIEEWRNRRSDDRIDPPPNARPYKCHLRYRMVAWSSLEEQREADRLPHLCRPWLQAVAHYTVGRSCDWRGRAERYGCR